MVHTKHKDSHEDCGYMVAQLTASDVKDTAPHEAEYFGIAMCVQGTAQVTINLEQRDISPNHVMAFTPQDLIGVVNMSDDFCMKTIYITRMELLREAAAQVLPFVMDLGTSRTFFTEEHQGVASIFNAVYTFLETILADKDTVSKYGQGVCVFRCLLLGMRDKSTRYREQVLKTEPANSMAHYNRFVVLLNKHCRLHHDVEHYARELHITSQYLGRICKKYDGRSAKQIICDTLILQLKSTLKNTEKTIKEISYEYNFATFPFMCSFFRRYTGLTPSEFRANYRNTQQHDGDEDASHDLPVAGCRLLR